MRTFKLPLRLGKGTADTIHYDKGAEIPFLPSWRLSGRSDLNNAGQTQLAPYSSS